MKLRKATLITALVISMAIGYKVQAATNVDYKTLWDSQASELTKNPITSSISTTGDKKSYTNNYHGYYFEFNGNWSIDKHRDSEYVRIYDGGKARVNITVDSIGTKSPTDFINEMLGDINGYAKNTDNYTVGNYDVQLYEYSRKASTIPDDLTNYAIYFVKDDNRMFIMQLKTSKESLDSYKKEVATIINSLKNVSKTMDNLNANVDTSSYSPSINYTQNKNSLIIPKNKVAYGIFKANQKEIYTAEYALGTHFGSQMFYVGMTTNYMSYTTEIVNNGRVPVVTFHPFKTEGLTESSIESIINGKYDSYLTSWANGVKSTESPVLIRIANEMNANWTDWSSDKYYLDTDLYNIAYRHIVDIFKQNGCKNAYFVWNPNVNSLPMTNWNSSSLYYPGDNYVDWVGLTSYNFGANEWGKFQYFDQLYDELYKYNLRNFPDKPMMIGEFASVENGGDKSLFIRDMVSKIPTKYPAIKVVIWFDEIDKQYNFKIDSSEGSKNAFIEAMKDSSIVQYAEVPNISSSELMLPKDTSTYNSLYTFTGVAFDRRIKSITINGIQQKFLKDTWRQFDQKLSLTDGLNVIEVVATYDSGALAKIPFTIRKEDSYKITTAGKSVFDAPVTTGNSMTVTGLVNDKSVQGIKINGAIVPIVYSWRQFDKAINLQNGLNKIIIEGYSDITCTNKINEASAYIYKDSNNLIEVNTVDGKTIVVKTTVNNTIVQGAVKDNRIKRVFINEEEATIDAQGNFSAMVTVTFGNNPIKLRYMYGEQKDGIYNEFSISRSYIIHTPSFRFSTVVSVDGKNISAIAPYNQLSFTATGMVIDNQVKSMTINGEPVDIKWSWRQFDKSIGLKPGVNIVTLVGYSDIYRLNEIARETYYIAKDRNSLKVSNLAYPRTDTNKTAMTVTGMVPDNFVNGVTINGIPQSIRYSWRQFDQPLTFSSGDNIVNIDVTYTETISGEVYEYTVRKPYTVHLPSYSYNSDISNQIDNAVVTDNNSIVVSGTILDSRIKSMSINGLKYEVGGSIIFKTVVQLENGLNEITIKGYSDLDQNNLISTEYLYVFNTGDLVIKNPETSIITVNEFKATISGWIPNKSIKQLRINGETFTNYQYDWRQFIKDIPLTQRKTIINVEADYENTYKGVPYKYTIKKTFEVNVDKYVNDINYSTPLGKNPETAANAQAYNITLTGIVKNPGIKFIKVNDREATLQYEWKQFDAKIELSKGMNIITVSGYKDAIYSEKIFEELVYINNPVDSIAYTTTVSRSELNPVVTDKNALWLAAFVKDNTIKSIKINGVFVTIQTIDVSTRQFGLNIYLDSGNNEFKVEGFSDAQGTVSVYEEKIYYTSTAKSIEYTTAVSTNFDNPTIVSKNVVWLGGYMKNSKITSLNVNGIEVPIQTLSFGRQFGTNVYLVTGINTVKIKAYIGTTLIVDEAIYYNFKQ